MIATFKIYHKLPKISLLVTIIKPFYGSLAQLVEQRPEEPCVPSSSLGGATIFDIILDACGFSSVV